tara:strand:+ start:998 stop:3301 length:2304 start_codon:yes stop_codon:yes gene_type:complete
MMVDRLPNQRDSGFLDRLRALRGGIGTTAAPIDYFASSRPPATNPGQLRGAVEQMFPFGDFGTNLDASLEQVRKTSSPIPMLDVSAGSTPVSQLLRGVANVPGFLANRLIDETGTYIAAPLHAAVTTGFSPTYQTYVDETVMPIAEGLFAEQQAAKARADKAAFMTEKERRLRQGIAGGPTYQQIPTPEDQTAALLAQQGAARDLSDSYFGSTSFTGDVGPDGQFVGGNVFMPEPEDRNPAGGTLFGDDQSIIQRLLAESSANADEAAAAQAQANAGAMAQDVTGGAERGTDMTGDGSGAATQTTTTQGDVTDITEQFDDLVEINPRFGADVATQPEEKNVYRDLLESSTNSVLEALGQAPAEAKTIEEYKQIFSDATGINVSGQPDNSAALTAFGLALMQNKAGKGFNVGKILSETGAAGEKALPLMVQAKKDARASQLAAGQFALTQQSKDKAARTAFINDQVTYLRDRRDTLNDRMVDRINAVEDVTLKARLEEDAQYQKFLYDRQIKLLEMSKKGTETENKTTQKPITGMDNLTITYITRKGDGQPMFLLPQQEAGRYGLALADVNDGIRSLDGVIGLIGSIAERPGGVTGQRVKETINRWSRSIGGPDYFKSEELGTNIPLEEAEAIKARVIAQYKRFLSQETGNGISEGDVNRLADALGKLDWFGNPDAAIARIKETQGIFQARKDKIVNEIEQFDNKDMYRNEKAYNDTMRSLFDQVNRAYSVFGEDMADEGVSGRNALISDLFNISEADGITTYSLKTS